MRKPYIFFFFLIKSLERCNLLYTWSWNEVKAETVCKALNKILKKDFVADIDYEDKFPFVELIRKLTGCENGDMNKISE